MKVPKSETIKYQALLDKYRELARLARHPEEDPRYPHAIRRRAALGSLYDNCGEDAELALKLDEADVTGKIASAKFRPIENACD